MSERFFSAVEALSANQNTPTACAKECYQEYTNWYSYPSWCEWAL